MKLISKYGYQSDTRCSNSLHMHLGSSGVLTPLKIFVKICKHMCTRCTLSGVGTFTKKNKFVKKRKREGVTVCDRTLGSAGLVRPVSGSR